MSTTAAKPPTAPTRDTSSRPLRNLPRIRKLYDWRDYGSRPRSHGAVVVIDAYGRLLTTDRALRFR